MKQRYTLLCLDNNGTPNKEFTFSKASIIKLSFIAILLTGALGAMGYDYRQTKNAISVSKSRSIQLKSHTETSLKQQQQIDHFSNKIVELKRSLTALSGFRDKIITLANLPDPKKVTGWVGIGGPAPESTEESALFGEATEPLMEAVASHPKKIAILKKDSLPSPDAVFDAVYSQNILKSTPLIQPVKGHTVLGFGDQSSPIDGKSHFHEGVKIIANADSSVLSAADGMVVYTGHKGFYGNLIIIDHGFGLSTYYAHVSKIDINVGDTVKRGEIIASINKNSESPFYYEVRIGGLPVNPFKYRSYLSLR